MQRQRREHREGRYELPSGPGRWLRIVNTLGVAAILTVVVHMSQKIERGDQDSDVLASRLSDAESRLQGLHETTVEEIRRIDEARAEQLVSLVRDLESRSRLASENDANRARLIKSLVGRADANHREVIASLSRGMQEIGTSVKQLDDAVSRRTTPEERFRGIQQRWDPSVFLVHCRFSYRTKSEDGRVENHEGSGWGTAFVVTKQGHLVTNKHVVEPWKFDPELAALGAMGEVEIVPGSIHIAAWRSGDRCMDAERNPALGVGFNNQGLKNLRVVARAPDHLVSKSMTIAGASLQYTIHDLDNNDLAIIKLEGKNFVPVECAPLTKDKNAVRKLDQVMALGFPRGQRGLEAGVAETSPSLGTVRKVEETIHITAPIIPGNSGGPLFNQKGQVVGVATRIYSETLGICLKIDHALSLLDEVVKKDEVTRRAPTKKPSSTVASHPVPPRVAESLRDR